jgi:DNA-binding NtrC family response regulator
MAELIRALVVDDEERVRYVLEETLRRVGHVVVTSTWVAMWMACGCWRPSAGVGLGRLSLS